MDDQFLYRARPPVRAEFAADLLQRLTSRQSWAARMRAAALEGRQARLRAGLIVIAIGTVAMGIWQGIEYFWERRGEFWVHEGDIQCLRVYWGEQQFTEDNRPAEPTVPIPVSEALAMLDYEVKLPTWAPEGLAMREAIPPPSSPGEVVFIYWEDQSGNMVVLSAYGGEYTPQVIAQSGAVDLIEIAGAPGMLIRGQCAFPDLELLQGLRPGSTYQTEWDPTMQSLIWRRDGVTYDLWTNGPLATAEDLVRMAESAR